MVLFSLLFTFCTEKAQVWKLKSQEQVASDYIANNPDQFSEFNKLVQLTGLGPLLSIRGPFTIMLPTNTAMQEYYKLKNVTSLADFDTKTLQNIIRNHIITNEIATGDIGLGALRDTNAIGDYLVTEFQGSDIILNKTSKIIKRDIPTANGLIQVIDRVIDPLTKDVYSTVAADPSFKIFSDGLNLTGIKDTLMLISFKYGATTARTRFTILAVADTTYQRYHINSVDDLIAWTGASKTDNLKLINNPFYRYMEYHCLNGSFFLSDLNTSIYPILSHDNNVSFTIDTDYKINLDTKTKKYTAFNVPASNVPSKNGALHTIADLLPVTDPEPAVIIMETTDFFDMKQGDYFGKYYMKFGDGAHTFAKIHWVGDFLQYYYKPLEPVNMHYDCLNMYGWWSLSVTFPKVMKGKYNISIFQPNWIDVTNCVAYVDGVKTNYTYLGAKGGTGGVSGLQKIAEVDFKATEEHTITLVNISYGGIWWDYVRFDPIK
jgi:uncharacterized surface protein with fasciclin (FAS1) repeats